MNNAIVIGGSSGIGKSVCDELLKRGFDVYNLSRTPCDLAGVQNRELDVTDGGKIESVLSELPVPEVVVYSAGFSLAAPVEYACESDYRYLFEVNFFGLVKTVRSLSARMRENGGGRIIAISSIGGIIPIAFDAYYSASKAAVDMFVREANIELNPYNIYLTSVRPGSTQTRFTFKRKVYPDEGVGVYGDKLHKAVVTLADVEQRGMQPQDVAQCVMNVLDAKKPPATANAGLANKSLFLAEKLLPEAFTDFLNRSLYLQ